MATQRHSDVWTTFRQVPAVLAAVCIALAPLAAAILSSQCDMEPKHSYDLRGRGGEGERSRLTFSVFPSKSGLLFISNDAETVKHDL